MKYTTVNNKHNIKTELARYANGDRTKTAHNVHNIGKFHVGHNDVDVIT